MQSLKTTTLEHLCKYLPQHTIEDLYHHINKKYKCNGIIHFDTLGGLKKSEDKSEYRKQLYKFMLMSYRIYNDIEIVEDVSENYKLLIKSLLEEGFNREWYFSHGFADEFENIIWDMRECGNIVDIDIQHFQDIESLLPFYIDDDDFRNKSSRHKTEDYDLLFKVGLNVRESREFIQFLQKHNALRFFRIAEIPIGSLVTVKINSEVTVKEYTVYENNRTHYVDTVDSVDVVYVFE